MQDKFEELKKKYPDLGNAILFSKLVKGKKMTPKQVELLFDKLVDKSDWVGTPKKQLIEFFSVYSGCKTEKNGG